MNIDVTLSKYSYDVLVCGSGMGGISAAVAAAQDGLKVGIIEYFGDPGGIPVSGRLGSIFGYCRLGEVAGCACKAAIAAGSTRKVDIKELQQKIKAMEYTEF